MRADTVCGRKRRTLPWFSRKKSAGGTVLLLGELPDCLLGSVANGSYEPPVFTFVTVVEGFELLLLSTVSHVVPCVSRRMLTTKVSPPYTWSNEKNIRRGTSPHRISHGAGTPKNPRRDLGKDGRTARGTPSSCRRVLLTRGTVGRETNR